MKKIVLFLALGMSLAFAFGASNNKEYEYKSTLENGYPNGFYCIGKSFERCLIILKNKVDKCYREQMLENNRR